MRYAAFILMMAVGLGSSGVALAQPTFTDFFPDEISYLGNTEFTITGSGIPVGVGITVRIGAQTATVTSQSPTQITGIAPPQTPSAGPLDVLVIPSGLGVFTIPTATTIIGPLSLTAVDPSAVFVGSFDDVTLTGVGFTPSTAVFVGGNQIPEALVQFIDARKLRFQPGGVDPGTHDVTVMDGLPGAPADSATLPQSFSVVDDIEINAFNPSEISYLGKTPFGLFGAGFTPATVVEFSSGELGQDLVFVDTTLLQGVAPPGAPGTASVLAIDPISGEAPLSPAFEYIGPLAIDEVNPSLVLADQGETFEVIGVGFTPDSVVEVDGSFWPTAFVDARNLIFEFSGLPAGVYDVFVHDSTTDGTEVDAVAVGAIVVYGSGAPSIEFVEPDHVCTDGNTLVMIHGGNFLPETQIRVGDFLLLDRLVSEDGRSITGRIPPLPIGMPLGDTEVEAMDFRGSSLLDTGVFYQTCSDLRPLEQFETSLAQGTAQFHWYNPDDYAAIEVYDHATGVLLDVLAGNETSYERPSGGASEVMLEFVAVDDLDQASASAAAVAAIYNCEYPPPIGGAVQAGELDLFVYGGSSPAVVDRCGDGGITTPPVISFKTGEPTQTAGGIGSFTSSSVLAAIGLAGAPKPTVLITGFELEQDADRIEVAAHYQKIATNFGLSLRGRLVHVFPDDGFVDEFTFPNTIIGDEKDWHYVTYYRATDDVSSGSADPCDDGTGGFLKIPAGEYRLEIYAVNGDPSQPYYVFSDDPRDDESLIAGVPCPPYPLVRVRDLTGLRTLPNITSVQVLNATQNPDGTVSATLSARGTWFDQFNNEFSIDPYCDEVGIAATSQGFTFICKDPPYNPNFAFDYCWTLRISEPAECKVDAPTANFTFPDWSCFICELTIVDKGCGTMRSYQQEVALLPSGVTDLCEPGENYFTFLDPSPDTKTIIALCDLSPEPGSGTFDGVRPLDVNVLVVPKCYCDQQSPCAGAIIEDTSGFIPDLTGPEDAIQFRLAVRQYSGSSFVLQPITAAIRVQDLCPNTDEGPKYFRVLIDDLGAIPRSPFLDPNGHDFSRVYLQGRTNYLPTTSGTPMPVTDAWTDIAWFRMTNSPAALGTGFWSGFYDFGTAEYCFTTQGTPDPQVGQNLGDTAPVDFGIVDAGIPSYSGQNVSRGFTSRFSTQGTSWIADDGAGTMSGSLFENDLQGIPHIIEPVEVSPTGFGFEPPYYEYCDSRTIFNYSMAQDLFRSIIYAGFIGPIPVNIWGSIGLGINITINSICYTKVAPFAVLAGGNYFEFKYILDSSVVFRLPCEISADILGGIASIALRLVPQATIDFQPHVTVALGSSPQNSVDVFLQALLDVYMEAEACVQTLIFGEQCLPTITIPLVSDLVLISEGTPPTFPGSCQPPTAFPATSPGGILVESYELVNNPFSVTSPNGQTVITGWSSADSIGRFLKVTVEEQGAALDYESGIPGIAWYFLDPAADFIDDDTALIVGTSPPGTFTPEEPPLDIMDPDYLTIRN
ncbi:MAG: IPT/TIG domain-containing protein, partial [Planctomycetes bacterium]|nr:IPT/TIG domain-containing protein [Planctomycetota bacterium]